MQIRALLLTFLKTLPGQILNTSENIIFRLFGCKQQFPPDLVLYFTGLFYACFAHLQCIQSYINNGSSKLRHFGIESSPSQAPFWNPVANQALTGPFYKHIVYSNFIFYFKDNSQLLGWFTISPDTSCGSHHK